jgi:pyruvate-formate lyase
MNQRLEGMKERVRQGQHHRLRKAAAIDIVAECDAEGLSWMRRAARLTVRQCEAEIPIIEPDERIVFTRTLPAHIPALYSDSAYQARIAGRTLHESGPISNICADWGKVLSRGVLGQIETAQASLERCKRDGKVSRQERAAVVEFLESAIETLQAVLGLAARYAAHAHALGRTDLAEMLERVPARPPRTFHEALQALRLLQAVVWLSGHYHVGLGRLDQYLWPYLQADLADGRLTEAGAFDLLAEFFISLNKDSDLYPGVQQGDNGQSITLGGMDREGRDCANPLTRLALQVSRDLAMIDPKINLRITANSDLDLLALAAELTRKGLGFPQYSNDDKVIPGLVAHGYALEDARSYAVAACWEFLIPGRGMDVVNIGAVSFPAAVDRAIRAGLPVGDGMEGLYRRIAADIAAQVERLAAAYEKLLLPPAPYYSALMTECLETGRDLSQGARYNNFGIHGAGAANAADALAAVEKLVLGEGVIAPGDLICALDNDFQGYEDLRRRLAEQGPKVGNDDPASDAILMHLFDAFSAACARYGKTSRGGILRPGTGSAMYYIWLAQGHPGMREPLVGATAEGRRKGMPLAANLAPTQGAQVRGPFSVLYSFSKLDYQQLCNGGPITMELSDTVFRDEESIRKVAMLVRTFAHLGCQQLQLNSLNVEQLRDAQAHPELHKNLIVRVWGWSGYFCELSREYQDQIIARHLYAMG